MATDEQNEVTLDTLGETLEPTKALLVRDGVWHNYRGRFRAEVRSFWRERYATTNIGMSNVTNAPDGFVAGPNGQGRAEGFFDYERKLRDGASFAALSDAHKQRQDLLQENMNRASAPDRERLTLLGLAEEASFSVVREANRPSLVREHGKSEALAYEADAAFAKLMDYDRKWNHPIMDPDRDFDTRPVTDQERLNWLTGRTDANGQSRKAENAFRSSDLSEAQYFEGSTELPHVYTKELTRSPFDAPIAIRTNLQQETKRREEDEKARAAERHAREAVEHERLATAKAQEVPFASPMVDPVAPAVMVSPEVAVQAAQVEATPEAVQVVAAAPRKGIPSLASLGEKLGRSKVEPEAEIAPAVVQEAKMEQVQAPQIDVGKPLDAQLGAHIQSVRGSEQRADQAAAKLGVQPSPHLVQQQKREQTREKAPALSVEETQSLRQSLGFKSRGIDMGI
ncbi:hypothetical protein OVY01_22475 [Robbsia sp. Bb-Pol-6]|uniref:Uncharacterized protein n=1 Tax=Robbsia betulipollinis TaxID=2981849 RepID=A0ABT3ZTL4_9BURK|nr:hypothetical protein [Robbsia betulipollinis]MCY0389908.1 hypothetical protein [Robbsia betulipollinis]